MHLPKDELENMQIKMVFNARAGETLQTLHDKIKFPVDTLPNLEKLKKRKRKNANKFDFKNNCSYLLDYGLTLNIVYETLPVT